MTKIPRTPLLLAVLALALYLPGFWWGAPHATAPDRTHSWGVDDETPLGPLAEMHNIIAPKPDRNLGYPLMSSFIVTGAYMPYLAYLKLTGGWKQVSGSYPFGMADPAGALRALSLIAHLVSVLMGVGIVLAAYDAGRSLWGGRTGLLAALFAMLSFPMFYYARTGNVDVPVLFFTALVLAVFARVLVGGLTVRRAAWLGCFVGFALATKEPAVASFLALPFVLLGVHRQGNKSAGWFSLEFWKAPLVGSLVTVLAFAAGSGLLVDHERYFAHVAFARQRLQEVSAGQVAFVHSYPFTLEGHWQLVRLLGGYLADVMTWPGLLLAVIGVAWALRCEPLKFSLALPALTTLLVLFLSARGAQLRYLMPVAFSLSFFAARAVTAAWESRRPVIKIGLTSAAVAALGLSFLRGADLTHAMVRDSRYAAANWLVGRTKPGTRIEYFGVTEVLPPLAAGVATQRVVENLRGVERPLGDAATVREIADGLQARRPDFVIIIPDLFSAPGEPFSGACPPETFQALLSGTLGYRLAASFQTPTLMSWVRRPALDYPVVNPPIHVFAPMDKELP